LVLKYRGALHRYIQTEKKFLDISSLGVAYRYVAQNRAKPQTKDATIWVGEPLTTKSRKGWPQPKKKGQRKDGQHQDNQSKPQAKKDTKRTKEDTRKWCDFHKIPWHNTVDHCSKKSLVAEVKASESIAGSDSESELERGRQIIDTEPSATGSTTKLQQG
jgi:hypothetical protein